MRDSYHTTSAAVRTLFPHPTSAGARRMLHSQGGGAAFGPAQTTAERERLRDANAAALYESTLAKTRYRYAQEYAKVQNRALLAREVILEPITDGMVEAHRVDLGRFHGEVVGAKEGKHAGVLSHPTHFMVTKY